MFDDLPRNRSFFIRGSNHVFWREGKGEVGQNASDIHPNRWLITRPRQTPIRSAPTVKFPRDPPKTPRGGKRPRERARRGAAAEPDAPGGKPARPVARTPRRADRHPERLSRRGSQPLGGRRRQQSAPARRGGRLLLRSRAGPLAACLAREWPAVRPSDRLRPQTLPAPLLPGRSQPAANNLLSIKKSE